MMSQVTDIILTCSLLEEDGVAIETVDRWLFGKHNCRFDQVDGYAGGDRAMQSYVLLCAVNYLDEEEFIAAVEQAGWVDPGGVRLMLKREEDEGFSIVLDDLWFRLGKDRA